MKKLRISAKALKECYNYHLNVRVGGMADFQTILGEPKYYNCGIYGWNFDAWELGDVVINSGYRNTFGLVTRNDALLREFEDKAKALKGKFDESDSWLYRSIGDTEVYYKEFEELAKNYRRQLDRLRVDLEFALIDKFFKD